MKQLFKCICPIVLLLVLASCNGQYKDRSDAAKRLMKEYKKHLMPTGDTINVLKEGKTMALESSEVQGVDHERYKEFDYWKEVDKDFFERVGEKSFSNPDEAGGSETTLEIFKAIKKGETEIRFYKRHYYGNVNPQDTTIVRDTAAILYSTYKFRIE